MRDPMADIKPIHGARSAPPGIISAADLQRIEFPPIKWIVPGVLPEGLTFLAGKP